MFVSRLRSRRLEVMGERENGRARGSHARGEVSPSRAPVFSCAHCFQAPATQVSSLGVQIAVEAEGSLRYR